MKKIALIASIFFGLSAITLVSCTKKGGFSGGKVDLSEDKARYSYAIGYQIGRNLKNQKIVLDINAFATALNDLQTDQKPQLTDVEVQKAIVKMSEAKKAKSKLETEANKKTGKDFLAANLKKEGFKATDSGLQYKTVKEGTGPSPAETDTVEVHYKGTLIDGTEFDSSYKRNKPAKFPLRGVIPGWTEGIQLMKVGGKTQFVIPSDLGYKERGNAKIPGNSVLIFDVELLGIEGKGDPKKKAAAKKGSGKAAPAKDAKDAAPAKAKPAAKK